MRRFAAEAVTDGCGYVCGWGPGCERVHDLFDEATLAASRLVTSTWHTDDAIHVALHFALVDAIPEGVSTVVTQFGS